MAHQSESCIRLNVEYIEPSSLDDVTRCVSANSGVNLLWLPNDRSNCELIGLKELISTVAQAAPKNSTIITVGEPHDLVRVHAGLSRIAKYQLWVAVKRKYIYENASKTSLPSQHFGCLVHTMYSGSLRHTKTRVGYSYCPACSKTTKDYGGKKHTYHEYGTLLSDVWRDIDADLETDIRPVVDRFADFFGLEDYGCLQVIDCRGLSMDRRNAKPLPYKDEIPASNEATPNGLICGDCLEELAKIPSCSVDFAFADPPYNLGKKYSGYDDSIEITDYFHWCDRWLSEMERVLKPGRTCAILNIPLWAIRHFQHMEKTMTFQNWIVWDALSLPVRMLMPAHYSIICFSKGEPRELPGLGSMNEEITINHSGYFKPLKPLGDGYCLRSTCVKKREKDDDKCRAPLTDLWWDIHRLKHNTRRVNHPCQLPPELMYRLISVFTHPGEMVLDCFNGAGTTSLSAAQLRRKFIGIEMAEEYHKLALSRHDELSSGLDPFRKEERQLTAKNSHVRRMPKIKYEVPKRTLQLDVKRIYEELGHMPSRAEVEKLSKYPISYFDSYFVSWGEVCAAARTTGMSETRENDKGSKSAKRQTTLV